MNRKNLLIVCRDMPANKGSTENIRLYNLILLLQSHFVISVVSETANYGTSQIKNLCKYIVTDQDYINFNTHLFNVQPDCVLISRWIQVSKCVDLIRSSKNKIRIVIDIPAVGFTQLEQRFVLKDDSFTEDEIEQYKMQEISIYNSVDACIVSCTADKNELTKLVEKPIHVVPHIYQIPDEQRDLSIVNRNNIYFIGDFTYSANVDAITWLYKDILPKMLFLNSNIKLHVIGSKIPDFVKVNKNVEVLNFIKDVYEQSKIMNICLAPIRIASGMIGKVCEAMSFGIPVVMTRLVAEQLSDLKIEHLKNAIVVDDNDTTAFAKATLKLVNSTNIISVISKNAKQAIVDAIDVVAIRNLLFEALGITSINKIEVVKSFIDDVVDTNNIGNFDNESEQLIENETIEDVKKVIKEVEEKIEDENKIEETPKASTNTTSTKNNKGN